MSTRLVSQHGDDVLVRVKAVPGASRDGLEGAIGDRLKIRVSAPAEGGRANKAKKPPGGFFNDRFEARQLAGA